MSNYGSEHRGSAAIVVDDGQMLRQYLVDQLNSNGFQAAPAWDMESLLVLLAEQAPEFVLLGIDTAGSAAMLQVLCDLTPRPKVVVFGLSSEREDEIIACAEEGADGLHMRTESFDSLLGIVENGANGQSGCSAAVSAVLLRHVYSVSAGEHGGADPEVLTDREEQVLDLLAEHLTNQQIASRLSISVHTVKNHVHAVLSKLGVNSRAEAVAAARARKYA